jgi:hypothetical protein
VHTKCQIIYTHWTYYVDAVQQQVYRMAEKVADCCKGTTVCEVGSGVLTGYYVYCVAWGGNFCPAVVEVDMVDCAALYYIYSRRPCSEMYVCLLLA